MAPRSSHPASHVSSNVASSEELPASFRRKPDDDGSRSKTGIEKRRSLTALPLNTDDDEFPFRSTKDEDERLAHAVARGKSVLWPVTFLSTLGIGVGCSAGGIVKTKEWSEPESTSELCVRSP